MSTFKQLRILILLLVLLMVAVSTWLTQLRTTDWDRPLVVAVYPINGDASDASHRYITALSVESFSDIDAFFREEAEHYHLSLKQPVEMVLGPTLNELPPEPPQDRNILGVIWWSLKMRFWARGVASDHGPAANIQMFVIYHDPKTNPRLPHSTGLQKGLVGVVHAFASRRQTGGNNMVVAHELLHTLGATDKYHLQTNQPIFPMGYAEPEKQPLLPQQYTEIMAGRRPVSTTQAEQPKGLAATLIGEYTALEIHWIEN